MQPFVNLPFVQICGLVSLYDAVRIWLVFAVVNAHQIGRTLGILKNRRACMARHRVKSVLDDPESLLLFLLLLNCQDFVRKIFRSIVIQGFGDICIFDRWETCQFDIVEI